MKLHTTRKYPTGLRGAVKRARRISRRPTRLQRNAEVMTSARCAMVPCKVEFHASASHTQLATERLYCTCNIKQPFEARFLRKAIVDNCLCT